MVTASQRLVTEEALNNAVARDTGWRDLSELLVNGWGGVVMARRANQLVQLAFRINGSGATGTRILSVPTPFAPSYPIALGITHRFTLDPFIGGDDPNIGPVVWVGIEGTRVAVERFPRSNSTVGSTMYLTTQSWTEDYPGAPV